MHSSFVDIQETVLGVYIVKDCVLGTMEISVCAFLALIYRLSPSRILYTRTLVIPRNDPQNDSKCIKCASESLCACITIPMFEGTYVGKSTVILHTCVLAGSQ